MPIYPDAFCAVSIDLQGQHFDGRYRVSGASVIAYFRDQVKAAPLDESVPIDRLAQWLLHDMAIRAR